MAAPRFDAVEIGDIECAKGMNRQNPCGNVKRRARFRERRHDRRIGMAQAVLGAHDCAVFQIDDRNDFERTLKHASFYPKLIRIF